MADPAGESNGQVLRLNFDRRLMLQFRGSVVTSDAGLTRPPRIRRRAWTDHGGRRQPYRREALDCFAFDQKPKESHRPL